jgi:hypothetical protein
MWVAAWITVVIAAQAWFWRFPALIVFSVAAAGSFWYEWLAPWDIMHLDEVRALLFGAILIVVACLLAYISKVNYSFWINKAGLIFLSLGASMYIDIHHVAGEWLAISLLLLTAAVFFQFPSYAGTGVLGVLAFINIRLGSDFGDQLWFPVVLLGQAMILALGAAYLPKKPDDGSLMSFVNTLRPKLPLGEPFAFFSAVQDEKPKSH